MITNLNNNLHRQISGGFNAREIMTTIGNFFPKIIEHLNGPERRFMHDIHKNEGYKGLGRIIEMPGYAIIGGLLALNTVAFIAINTYRSVRDILK